MTQDKMNKILSFSKKIASKITVEDYKLLQTQSVEMLLTGYGYPKTELEDLTEAEKEDIVDTIYNAGI